MAEFQLALGDDNGTRNAKEGKTNFKTALIKLCK